MNTLARPHSPIEPTGAAADSFTAIVATLSTAIAVLREAPVTAAWPRLLRHIDTMPVERLDAAVDHLLALARECQSFGGPVLYGSPRYLLAKWIVDCSRGVKLSHNEI